MKYIKPYNEYDKVNEELTRTQRAIINIPRALGAFALKKIFGIYPMLNFRWREMKRGTKDSKYDSLVSSPSLETMKDNIEKVSQSDLPDNNMKYNMLLRNWNIYLSDRRSKGGRSSGPERPVVYISKDEIKKGDKYLGGRLTDKDIYPDFSRDAENFAEIPMIIMIAKFDNADKVSNTQQYVDDICLELEDDFPVSAEPRFNAYGDYLYIPVKITNNKKLLEYDESLMSRLEEVGDRIKEYLKTEEYNFDYDINLTIKGPIYYFGEKDRFKEINVEARVWSKKWDYDKDYPLWVDKSGPRDSCLNLSVLGTQHGKDILKLHPDDIRTILSDLSNCSKSNNSVYKTSSDRYKVTQNDIQIRTINIVFKKIRS